MSPTNGKSRVKVKSERNRTIPVTCHTDQSLPLDQIVAFQGEFKTLNKPEFEKLKASIVKYGLSFPSYIWKQNGSMKCIDGHQRSRVLGEMQKEGYEIPPIPVVYVDAKNEAEAKEKILLLSSQYGRYTQESLYEFIEQSDLDFGDLEQVLELPQIDLGQFKASFYDEPTAPESFKQYSEDIEIEHVCPKCGYQFSGGEIVKKNEDGEVVP